MIQQVIYSFFKHGNRLIEVGILILHYSLLDEASI